MIILAWAIFLSGSALWFWLVTKNSETGWWKSLLITAGVFLLVAVGVAATLAFVWACCFIADDLTGRHG